MTADTLARERAAPRTRSPWAVLAATSTGVVAVFLSTSGLTVALPTLTRSLHASATQATWVLLAYMLTTTALILVFGRLADIVGRRSLYLAGLAVFTAATAGCALAPSAPVLIAGRVAAGVGAAAVVTNTTALLTDVFAPARLGRALGANASVAAVAQVLGPVVGGAATAGWGWSGLFRVCAPLGLIALATSALVLPRPARGRRGSPREPFDVVGALLSVTALTAVVVALTPDGSSGGGLRARGAGALALLALVALVLVQGRRRHPLIDLELFRDRARAATYAAVLLQATSAYALVLLASLSLQASGGVGPLEAGLLVAPAAVGTLLAAVAAGGLTTRCSPRALTLVGMAAIAAGLVAAAHVLGHRGGSPQLLAAPLFAVGVGTGLFMTPSTSALMLAVPAHRRGIANGLRSALQNVGYLLSTALALVVATAGLDPATRRAAYDGTLDALGAAQLAAFTTGVHTALSVLATLALVGLATCLLLPGRATPTDGTDP